MSKPFLSILLFKFVYCNEFFSSLINIGRQPFFIRLFFFCFPFSTPLVDVIITRRFVFSLCMYGLFTMYTKFFTLVQLNLFWLFYLILFLPILFFYFLPLFIFFLFMYILPPVLILTMYNHIGQYPISNHSFIFYIQKRRS